MPRPELSIAEPRLVLMLSEAWTMVDPRDLRGLVGLAKVAEDAGVDGVMLGEHVTLGRETDGKGVADNPREWIHPGNQPALYGHPHGLHVLGAMAAVTERIRLIAAALLTPFRHALVLAKELATVDLISQGRLVHMPVVGSVEEEFRALGVPFHERGRIFEEQLEIWERVWREDFTTYHGRYYAFDEMAIEPKPWRENGPALWIGGARLHDNALRRTVRYASGYFPQSTPTGNDLERLSAAMRAAGRSLSQLELVAFVGQRTGFPDSNSTKSLSDALEDITPEIELGMTTYVLKPSQYIDEPAQLGDLCRDTLAGLRQLAAQARA